MKKRLTRNLMTLLLGGALVWIMLRWFEHSQIYHPDRVFESTGAELGRPFEDVWFESADGIRLNGWFYPAATNSPRSNLVVLVCHGNAGNISHRLDLCRELLQTGVSVFLFDYRGYGRSQGRPSEEGTYQDAQAACRWLERKDFATQNIIAFGESLGGGVVSELALRERLGGIVLQSTFTCMVDIGCELFPWLPVRWLCTIKYDTYGKLPRVKVPVLVMHSKSDELIRFRHAERNFAHANEPKVFCELDGEHNDPVSNRIKFNEGMEQFLRIILNDFAAAPSGGPANASSSPSPK